MKLIIALMLLSLNLTAQGAEAEVQKRWNNLSDSQKQRLRENYDRWKQLDPQKQSAIKENFKRFREIPTEERQKLVQRYQVFRSLPPERQQRIRERFAQFQKLPREERQERLKRLEEFRGQRQPGEGPGLRPNRDDKNRPPGPDRMLRDGGPRPFRQGEGGRSPRPGGDKPPPPR